MRMADKYKRTFDYLKSIADKTEDGYFYLDTSVATIELDISKSTLFRHLDKLKDKIFRVYEGTFVPDGLTQEILRDSGKTTKILRSLYYIPRGTFDSQYKRDMAILRYCFGWKDNYIKHYQWWANAANLEYDENLSGLSKKTEELLKQYFQYVVNERFEFDNNEIMDEFERLTLR